MASHRVKPLSESNNPNQMNQNQVLTRTSQQCKRTTPHQQQGHIHTYPFWGTKRRERKVRGGKGRKGEGRNEGRKVGKRRGMPCKNETVVCSIPNFTLTVLYCCPA